MSYLLDYSYKLGAGQGASQVAQRMYVIAHDTANDNNNGVGAATNEAIFMHNNWRSAYTTHIVGWDRVYVIGEPGYVSWGAGNANPYSPAQVELTHYGDRTKALQAYAIYVELLHDLAVNFGVPVTLDAGGAGVKGTKSHKWVSDHIWGDHQDPYGYLSKIGISKEQFERDLAVGKVGSKIATVDPNVLKIVYTGLGGVKLLNSKGEYIEKYLAPGTAWKVFGTGVINGVEMALLGTEQWVPLKYTDWAYNECEVTYDQNVRLLDDSATYLNKYCKPGSKWKIKGVKIINKEVMYLIGNNEYIPKKYVHVYMAA